MKIGTWNVNSVKARKDRLLGVLDRHAPDVLCLQELKVVDDAYPHEEVEAAGYRSAVHGQKTYNGVAILTKEEPTAVRIGMGDDEDDPQARIIAVTTPGEQPIDVVSVYVPNGGKVESDKHAYKLRWLERFMGYLDRHYTPESALVVCGDLNIAPDERDVARPDEWGDSVLCVDNVRAAYRAMMDWGLQDCFRKHHEEAGYYSWWDYRQLGFPKNNGLRIDHVLATTSVAERCTAAEIDRNERKGKQPSDHAPVLVTLT
ncbi:MAG: exodeoxyribonuclease III [Myxococcales bacterium]|nr:exodeoxyribonuclease III [Myxococcales bacterium]